MKETQTIDKSLAVLLDDVIAALGEKSRRGDKRVPYRSSLEGDEFERRSI